MKSGEKADTVAKYKVGGGGVDSDGEVPDPVHIMAQGEAAVAPTLILPEVSFLDSSHSLECIIFTPPP